jgi:hypothetical protein
MHTGLTRRRSRQRAQRPANGHQEAPQARVHARESALARRSRRRLRRPRHSATCGPLARRPGRSACRSRGTWIRGETQRAAPMPTAQRAVGEWEAWRTHRQIVVEGTNGHDGFRCIHWIDPITEPVHRVSGRTTLHHALLSPRRAVGPAGTRVAHTRGHSQREQSGTQQFSAERWRVMMFGDGPSVGRHGKWWNRAPWDTGRVAPRGLCETVTPDQGVARSGAALTWRLGSGLSTAGRRRRQVLVGRTALQTRHGGRGYRGARHASPSSP